MADGKKEERRSIRDSAKSLKKYGSTCNHFKRQDHFVKHAVVEGETLQGIALKYGVTVSILHIWAQP
jgi:LysM repeat protein